MSKICFPLVVQNYFIALNVGASPKQNSLVYACDYQMRSYFLTQLFVERYSVEEVTQVLNQTPRPITIRNIGITSIAMSHQ